MATEPIIRGRKRQQPDESNGRPSKYVTDASKRFGNDGFNLDNYLKEMMDYDFPEEELQKRLNALGIQITAAEQSKQRTFSEKYAAQTGGRMTGLRGFDEIGGKSALARSVGSAQIMQQAFNQELAVRQNALNAYIQKYGMDKQAQAAQAAIDAQKEQANQEMIGNTFGTLATLLFMPDGIFDGIF